MHLHHPDHAVTQGNLLKSIVLTAALLWIAFYARLSGRPVVWMVHDVEPAWVRRKTFLFTYMKAINQLTTAYIFLNQSSQQLFSRRNPREVGKPYCFTPHSRFQTKMFEAAAVREHRQAHGIGDAEILISVLGSITPHKGLERAALIPEKTRSGRTVKLAVCGMIDNVLPRDYVDTILGQRSGEAYLRVADRLTDEELALWIQSSDAVFLPYQLGSNSGMALNVLSNHGRIISSDLPMFKELAERCGPSWIRCVDLQDAAALAGTVDAIEAWTGQERDFNRLEGVLTEGDPVENGRKLLGFYRDLQRTTGHLPGPLAAS